jgi:hypothetical protein
MPKLECCLEYGGAMVGYFCVSIAYVCMGYADYAMISWMILPTFQTWFWRAFHIVLFNILLLLAFVAHFRAMTCNPGTVPISKQQNSDKSNPSKEESAPDIELDPSLKQYFGEGWTFCNRCEIQRPPRAHHCRICKRCIRKMDHHCPWINNCVGEFNQKYFLQFLIYIGLLSIYGGVLILISWLHYTRNSNSTGTVGKIGMISLDYKIIHTVGLSLVCATFGIFVVAIMFNQLYAIFREETMIESVQKRNSILRRNSARQRSELSKCELLGDVCGQNIHWTLWMLPCFSLPTRHDVVRFSKRSEDLNV